MRRSSTCGSARACAAAACSSRSRRERPSALDANAQRIARYAPGDAAAFLAALADELAGAPETELAKLLRDGGEDVVIVWGERIGAEAAAELLRIAELLDLSGHAGAGLLEIPAGSNGRGLREAGVLPNAGPGYLDVAAPGRGAAEIARAAADGRDHRALSAPDRSGPRPARTGRCGRTRCIAPASWSRTRRC